MASDMTTAEMVAQIRKYHANTEAVGPHEYDAQMLAIAARLEALDRVARAGQSVVDAVWSRHGRIVDLGAALKEAGYGA